MRWWVASYLVLQQIDLGGLPLGLRALSFEQSHSIGASIFRLISFTFLSGGFRFGAGQFLKRNGTMK
jgi:hypothetical protein